MVLLEYGVLIEETSYSRKQPMVGKELMEVLKTSLLARTLFGELTETTIFIRDRAMDPSLGAKMDGKE